MSIASAFLRKLNEEVDMGQADSTLRKGTSKSFKYAVVDSSGKTVSTHNDQGSAATAALKNDTYKVKKLKESMADFLDEDEDDFDDGPAGSGWGSLKKGKKITSFDTFKKGQSYLTHSNQFNADNVIRITKVEDNKVKAIFVNPEDTSKTRMGSDQEFVIWDFYLDHDTNEYYTIKK